MMDHTASSSAPHKSNGEGTLTSSDAIHASAASAPSSKEDVSSTTRGDGAHSSSPRPTITSHRHEAQEMACMDPDDGHYIEDGDDDGGTSQGIDSKSRALLPGGITGALYRSSSGGSSGGGGSRHGTVFGTSFNTLCNVMGAGVLSLPFAMYEGSIIVSLLLLALSSCLGAFAVFALTYACEVTRKFSYTECLSFSLYPNVALDGSPLMEDDLDEGVYGEHESTAHRRRRWITIGLEMMIFLNNFGALVIYSRVIADSIPPVLADFFGASGVWTTSWLWLVAPAVIFFVLSCARSMNELKWTSIVGFVTILYIVIMVIVRYFSNLDSPIDPQILDASEVDVNLFKLDVSCFSTLSAYALAYGYHYNVPYFYEELKDRTPAVMMETVKNAFPIITVCYGATGLLGYLTFGSLVASSAAAGNIVNNYGPHDTALNIGRLGLFFHFVSVYPIMSVCARRGLHRFVSLLRSHPTLKEDENGNVVPRSRFDAPPGDPSTTTTAAIITEAFAIVVAATLLAAFVPGIGVVVELIGTLFGIPLMFIVPGVIGVRTFQTRHLIIHQQVPRCALWRRVSVGCTITGIVFLACGIAAFIIERSEGR